ncbi:hypothetical protein UFOVP413_22 [uncultured Caudovirales phage]|uniref:Uncharacterized protein n=1 Tax=uncultured Caudovirales phage TaxID=2100421 RepID=A0A6J5M2R5_9CAUD|nr:hypothetical protein UFOVP413_22 [uncultured Caudovirales phage]
MNINDDGLPAIDRLINHDIISGTPHAMPFMPNMLNGALPKGMRMPRTMPKQHGMHVRFYLRAEKNQADSNEQGRAMFREIEYVEIKVPGDKLTCVDREVTDDDKEKYFWEYLAFKSGQDAPVQGTPIEQWPILSVAEIEELKYYGVRTVEDLVNMSDTNLNKIGMGSLSLRERAKAWLDSANEGADMQRLAMENAKLKEEIKDLRDSFREIRDAQDKTKNKSGGRSKKAVAEDDDEEDAA